MTASVVEVQTGTVTASTTGTFNLSTTLVSSDVVVFTTSRTTLATPSYSGLGGASWTLVFSGAANSRAYSAYASGVTGSGQSVSVTAGAGDMGACVQVIRGLNSVTVTEQHSVWSATTTASNTDEFSPSQSFGTDQVAVLMLSGTTSSSYTVPSNPTPSSGWVTDLARATNPTLHVAHLIGTSPGGTVIGGARNTSAVAFGVTVAVFGTETSGPPPLTSSFVGWGNPIF